ncbi:MAG: hypothetical protein IKC11_01995, partial [Clostridia bacterium]|nr:hypothetical protein [Clostridia bacterium]
LYYLPSLDNTNANLGGFILFNNETLNIDFEYSNVTGGFYRLLIKDDYFIAFGEKANAVKVSLIDLSYTVTSIPKASYFIDRNDGTLFITNTNDGGWARIYDIETDSFTDVIIDESVTSGALSYQINASGFVTSTNKIIYTNGFSGTTGGTFIYTPENNTLYEMCDHVHGYVMNSPTTGISEFIEIGDEIIYDYSYDYFIDMLSFKCHKFNANNLQTDYHYITADRKVLTSGYNGLFLIDIENDSETRMTTYDRTGETLYEELDNGVLVTMFCQEDGNTYYFFYNYETQTISELDEPIRNILLVNATTIDESSFEEESISSLYIGQEVELFITVPMGHYPSHFEVLTLDAEGNEVWTSFDCNGGMNGMTRFNCKFVLEESLIINNTLTIRYNNFTSL